MSDGYGIAAEAHNLVYGARAETYGHPRFDFKGIAKVWTGLLQDVLKEDAELDEYRVAVLMTGLKLCRLVKSPDHHDSRVDTIGYMLTMERLDEPEDEVTKEERDAIPDAFKLQTYLFPDESPGLGAGYTAYSINAYTYEEARQKWEAHRAAK